MDVNATQNIYHLPNGPRIFSNKKQIIIKSEAQEHYNLDECTVLDQDKGQFEEAGSDNDYVPEVQQGKKKRGRSRNAVTDKTYELVKNQCGRHTLASMSFMLNIETHSPRIYLPLLSYCVCVNMFILSLGAASKNRGFETKPSNCLV